MRAKREKALKGKWLGQGAVPYGYRKVGEGPVSQLEIDEQESAVVKRIYNFYTQPSTKRLTLTQIANLLMAEGVPPPSATQGRGRGKVGRGWYLHILRRILKTRVYQGEFVSQGQIIYLPELALVDEQTWNMAQERRKRRLGVQRNRKWPFLLSGRVHCNCTKTMSGLRKGPKGGKSYLYYVCANGNLHDGRIGPCGAKTMRAEVIDHFTWHWLTSFVSDPARFDAALQEMINNSEANLAPLRKRVETANELINKLDARLKRIVAAYTDEDNDELAAVLKHQAKDLAKQKEAVVTERNRLLAEIRSSEITPDKRLKALELAAIVRSRVTSVFLENKKELIELLDLHVEAKLDDNGNRYWVGRFGLSEKLYLISGGDETTASSSGFYHLTRTN